MHGYVINKDLGLVVIKFRGETTIEQVGKMLLELAQDPDYSFEMNLLSDSRELTSAYSHEKLQALVEQLPDPGDLAGTAKSAIVATDDAVYGMSRTWSSITDHNRTAAITHVFRDMKEALEWLGLPADAEIEFPF